MMTKTISEKTIQSIVKEEDNGIECSDCHEKFDSESDLHEGICASCMTQFLFNEQTTGDK